MRFLSFRERESSFSLDFWLFGPSVLDGVRSKVDLRVDTDLVEFRQLQEVRIFSYLCYSLAKSHVNGWGCSEAWISRVFGLKYLNRVEKILIVVAMNSANPRVSLFM